MAYGGTTIIINGASSGRGNYSKQSHHQNWKNYNKGSKPYSNSYRTNKRNWHKNRR
jgi:hypothetical protein